MGNEEPVKSAGRKQSQKAAQADASRGPPSVLLSPLSGPSSLALSNAKTYILSICERWPGRNASTQSQSSHQRHRQH
jgi:hypothetical protein